MATEATPVDGNQAEVVVMEVVDMEEEAVDGSLVVAEDSVAAQEDMEAAVDGNQVEVVDSEEADGPVVVVDQVSEVDPAPAVGGKDFQSPVNQSTNQRKKFILLVTKNVIM